MIYTSSNKEQKDTMIGEERVHLNPATGLPQTFGEKKCKVCGELYTPLAPSHLYCCQFCADFAYAERYLKRNYNISFEDASCLYEKQEGKCAICNSRGFRMNPNAMFLLVLDHNHDSGEVRGFLCHNCNRAIGLLQESHESLLNSIEYLKRATTISKESRDKCSEAVDKDDMV